jgi:hypothetical protein
MGLETAADCLKGLDEASEAISMFSRTPTVEIEWKKTLFSFKYMCTYP